MAVGNALRLLRLYGESEALRITDAARLLGVGRATAHRLFTTLKAEEFVVQDRSRAYRPGPALRELSAQAARIDDVQVSCQPYLAALCDEIGETVNLVMLRGRDAAFVASVETPRPIRVVGRDGTVLPAHSVSAGKALLAELSAEQVRHLYPDETLPALTERTLRSCSQLLLELQTVRKCGYAVNIGESQRAVTAVACVIPGSARGQAFAIAVSAPSSRVRDGDDVLAIANAVSDSARRVGAELELFGP